MRLLDFENYDHNASAPFAFEVTGAEIGGCVGIPLYVNSSAGTYYSKNGGKKHWRQDTCISLYDILSVQGMSQQGYVNCYLGFCIHDLTQSGTTVIVTRQKIGSISTTVPTIILYSNGTTQSGITYPAIPMLQTQSGRAGHTFRFIAALFQNFPGNEATDAYYVYPDLQQSIDVYSLAFVSGIDRKEVVMNLYDTITGLTCTLGQSGMKLERLTDTETFYEYRISGYVLGTFVTPNVWRRNSVGVEIKVSSDYGYVGETNVIYNTAANIRMASHTYSNLRLQYIDVPVHIYKSVPQAERSVKIEAWATNITERIAFDNNPLVIHTTE